MYQEERRQAILDELTRSGRVEVNSLAESFDVTPETIRRDLTELERHKRLRRVHGGALSLDGFRPEPALDEKATVMAPEKARIAEAALAFLPERGTVLLDAGTTTLALAAALPDRELTVVTNALPVGMALARHSHVQVWVVGGRVRGRTLANVDDWALRTLADLNGDVAFIGTNGVSVERGLSTPDPAEAAVKRAMCRAAKQVVVLADHTKVGEEHAIRFAPIEGVDVLITDGGLDPGSVEALERSGVEVVLA
ncbi:MAG: DeoR/GlpR transcriptional regulator [Actinobacteria bacterium]|nr:DeoR/GlpR transcriptional regulator [Actinomycetota bacterium]